MGGTGSGVSKEVNGNGHDDGKPPVHVCMYEASVGVVWGNRS